METILFRYCIEYSISPLLFVSTLPIRNGNYTPPWCKKRVTLRDSYKPVSTLPIRNGNVGSGSLPGFVGSGKYLTYKEWKQVALTLHAVWAE